MEKIIKTLEELETEAMRFVAGVPVRDGSAALITLSGELGAGKTAFAKAVAGSLGVVDQVTSPTFVLEKVYQLGGGSSKFKKMVHIDAYRLESGSELSALNFDELMRDSGNLILLEWPEKVAEALPIPAVKVSIVANVDGSRTISYA